MTTCEGFLKIGYTFSTGANSSKDLLTHLTCSPGRLSIRKSFRKNVRTVEKNLELEALKGIGGVRNNERKD
jgi:hypothetical protein